MPSDENERRQKARERLQNRLRQRHNEGIPMTPARLAEICEEELTNLMTHMNTFTTMGFPIDSPAVLEAQSEGGMRTTTTTTAAPPNFIRWSIVMDCIESTLNICDRHMETYNNKNLGMGKKSLLNKSLVVHLKEAQAIFKRLGPMVAKLPRDMLVRNPIKVELKRKEEMMATGDKGVIWV